MGWRDSDAVQMPFKVCFSGIPDAGVCVRYTITIAGLLQYLAVRLLNNVVYCTEHVQSTFRNAQVLASVHTASQNVHNYLKYAIKSTVAVTQTCCFKKVFTNNCCKITLTTTRKYWCHILEILKACGLLL